MDIVKKMGSPPSSIKYLRVGIKFLIFKSCMYIFSMWRSVRFALVHIWSFYVRLKCFIVCLILLYLRDMKLCGCWCIWLVIDMTCRMRDDSSHLVDRIVRVPCIRYCHIFFQLSSYFICTIMITGQARIQVLLNIPGQRKHVVVSWCPCFQSLYQ